MRDEDGNQSYTCYEVAIISIAVFLTVFVVILLSLHRIQDCGVLMP